MIKNLIKNLIKNILSNFPRKYSLGKYSIKLNSGHKLDVYQSKYKNYDKKLPLIAKLIENKYGDFSVVDVGANIGDSAVAIRQVCEAKIICIEGEWKYFKLLEENTKNIPGVIKNINCFLGAVDSSDSGQVISKNGTARIELEAIAKKTNGLNFVDYEKVLNGASEFPRVKLVKIDTDGFDFKIIKAFASLMSRDESIIFFEFDPSFSSKKEQFECIEAIDALMHFGYKYFVIYDNFGNFITSVLENHVEKFIDFYVFLAQSRKFGGGVYYFDVCAFVENDRDIFEEIVADERRDFIKGITNFD